MGISRVPVVFWEILKETPDPSDALIKLIRRLGCDPTAVRQRDAQQLQRFRDLVTLVAQVEADPSSLDERQRLAIEAMMRFGDHRRLAELRSVFIALNTAIELYQGASGGPRFKAYRDLIDDVQKCRKRALSTPQSKAEGLLAASRSLAVLAARYNVLDQRRQRIAGLLSADWLSFDPTSEEKGFRDTTLRRLAEIDALLFESAVPDIEGTLSQFDNAVSALERLFDKLNARKSAHTHDRQGAEQEARGNQGPRSEVEQALALFGFEATAKPSKAEVDHSRRRLMKVHYPRVIDDPEFKRKEALCKEINVFHAVLYMHFGYA